MKLVVTFLIALSFIYPLSLTNPDFWIKQITYPDAVRLTTKRIEALNKEVKQKSLYGNPLDLWNRTAGSSVKTWIDRDFSYLIKMGYVQYDGKHKKINPTIFTNDLWKNISIPKCTRNKYGIAVRPAVMRAFPTDTIVYQWNDTKSDINRKDVLDIGDVCTGYITTDDRKFTFIEGYYCTGWVKTEDLAWESTPDKLKAYRENTNFVIVTAGKSTLSRPKYACNVRIGSKFPFVRDSNKYWIVSCPVRNDIGGLTFYELKIDKKDSSKGYLKLTQRNVINISFGLLDTPYVWGGSDIGLDCSSFTQKVYSVFGLTLPRSAHTQLDIMQQYEVKDYDKMVPGLTILYHPNPGHVMIYLGEYRNNFYVIHDFWSVYTNNVENVIAKVSVTSLGSSGRYNTYQNMTTRMGRIE